MTISSDVSHASFRERVHALVGHTTWRESSGGGARYRNGIPGDHMIAAALSFGRAHAEDIGPDIAFDIATGRAGHYGRVCAALGKALGRDRSVLVRRNRACLGHVSMAAYHVVMGTPCPAMPAGMAEADWRNLVAAGACVLERMAEDALALAARKARFAA